MFFSSCLIFTFIFKCVLFLPVFTTNYQQPIGLEKTPNIQTNGFNEVKLTYISVS